MTKSDNLQQQNDPTERREFIATAGKLAAVLAAVGLTGEALAAEDTAARMVLESALKTGNMKSALAEHGKGLDKSQLRALESLSTADLRQLGNLQSKLKPLGKGTVAHGIGIF